ncbi:calcitonin gene-related peptide [Esox lucius]|uniref:Calcitonin peptide-like domain-containing protein n=1 Tax=Esox lucius TaxID=8010 RepID=A0AAY5JZJ9_ESOLU|nr:calcitonin gene-related peptide [Esox lucius]
MMYHLKQPALLLVSLMLLRCFATAPGNRYFTSTNDQEGALRDSEGWLIPRIISNPFLNLMGVRQQRGLTSVNSHHIEKRKCNTATCVTQRLADFLTRSSNTIGTVYTPTNVGSSTYGKRELLQPPPYLPL